MDWQERGYCGRCSAELQDYNSRRSLADGLYYCKRCAQSVEQERLARTTCAICKRQLQRQQPKIVMPSTICAPEPVLMTERLLCVGCYKRITYRSAAKAKVRAGGRPRPMYRAAFPRAYAVQ